MEVFIGRKEQKKYLKIWILEDFYHLNWQPALVYLTLQFGWIQVLICTV